MTKTIYIYSPSGAVRDKAAFKRGVARLKSQGHSVEVDEAALASHQRFAGDDETRLAAVHRAAASGADVALISRGGYGLTRLLHQLDYKALAKAIEGGTQFVGMSDFTALQLAVLAKTGSQTWAGPALCEGFGGRLDGTDTEGHGEAHGAPDDIMEACFNDMLQGQGEGVGWRQPAKDIQLAQPEWAVKNGILWGGNLCVLAALLGTPFFPVIKGGVLFLEDVAEQPYRIERMLTQLLHAGVLDQQKAIVLGQFTRFKLTPHDRGFKLDSVVQWLRGQVKTPVVTNMPFGHVATKVLLPVGAKVDLVVQGRDALMAWGHV